MTPSPALELRNVARYFGAVTALDDAALVVTQGTVHALLGENGAGKTTLVRIAFGMLQPDRGSMRMDGIERKFATPSDAIAAGIGLVQQHPANVPAMSVWENVMLGGGARLHPRDARKRVVALAAQMGFALDPDAPLGTLSVAAQQRVEILKAISRDARVLILDEPTAILAPSEAADLYMWLRSFATHGGAVVVVTHKLDEARQFTDDLTVLRGGRTVLTAPSSTVSATDLTIAMIGESLAEPTPGALRETGEVIVNAKGLHLQDERNTDVVRDATFEVRTGEIIGVAGVEGSGHHQLLLALAGRHPVAGGSLTVPARRALVPEDRHRDAAVVDFDLTENVALNGAGARRGRIDWNAMSDRASSLLRRFDVRAENPRVSFSTLSGGNQQKLILARELEGDPQLIVVENPTRGLDVRAGAFVRSELRAARDRGAAVVFYSSDLDEIVEMSDRVLVVHSGVVTSVPRDRMRIGAAMLGAA